jgi:hypothetical protein
MLIFLLLLLTIAGTLFILQPTVRKDILYIAPKSDDTGKWTMILKNGNINNEMII